MYDGTVVSKAFSKRMRPPMGGWDEVKKGSP
jgi:hypothetical protein